jgi:hypothetical protein
MPKSRRCTSCNEDQQLERNAANKLGFDFHLVKPVDECEFHRALLQISADEGLPACT